MKKRLFIAIPLSDDWLGVFGDFQKRCNKEFDLKDEKDFRWTKVDNLHITICFLGWIEEEKVSEISQKLKEVLERVKRFDLEFDNMIFAPPHKAPYMIWGVFKNSRAYQELVKSVNETMKEFSEEVASEEDRELIPHTTLARFKDGRMAKKEEMLKLFSAKENILKIDNIQLMESKLSPTGPTYSIVENFILKMRTYKLLSHTADIRMKVEADSLPELFVAAIEGMNSILKESRIKKQEARIKRNIEIQSVDMTVLLIDFMNEVLYQAHKNKEIYDEVNFLEFSETTLKAEICGHKVDEFDEDIKAVTYHEAEIIKNEKGNFETTIVFDI